ncbi:hypothetical protein [Staphylococcus saprophyticus]|uniref:hypothetical protein n=1 Tax=Staphylococcus saprophyticus TaxID=29385 RepID=UPI000F6C2A58|nr:hypothetical protein [Staphylococcus saprophyticus]VDZ21356.1 Uncharacterised protein [Staphylococcus saprophyticus]
MEWTYIIAKYVQNLGSIMGLLSPIIYFIYSYSERRILTDKIDKFFLLLGLFFLNIIIYSIFIILFLSIMFYKGGWDNFNHNLSGVTFLSSLIFLILITSLLEIFYQSKLRIAFTLIKTSNLSGILIKQKTTESHRIIKYQSLNDISEEKEISEFYKKIYREIALPITEEYIENNYFVSNIICRLKSIKKPEGKISFLVIEIISWLSIFLIGIVGVIIAQIFELKDPWILSIVIVMVIISMAKNMFCMKTVIDKNEELMRNEYENWKS